METVHYQKAIHSWGRPTLSIVDQSGQILLSIPLEFASTGFCNTMAFVISQLDSVSSSRGLDIFETQTVEFWLQAIRCAQELLLSCAQTRVRAAARQRKDRDSETDIEPPTTDLTPAP